MDNFNIEKQSKELSETTVKSIKGLFPVHGRDKTLELASIWADDNLDVEDYNAQRKVKVGDRTWGIPIYGSFKIKDKNGKVVSEKKKVRLATLPKLTPRFSYIIKGSEHQIANQLRLRPAGYTVKSQNGLVKGQINLAKGYSGQIGMTANQETGVFRINVGQAKQRLYPILSALGVSDSLLAKKWGQGVLEANKQMKSSEFAGSLKSFAKSVTGKSYSDGESAAKDIREFVERTKMDPKVNDRTVGGKYNKMTGQFLADLSGRLLNVMKGEEEPHDRNSLEFKEYRTIQDLVEERLSMGEFSGKIKKTIANNLNSSAREGVDEVINSTVIGPHIESVFALPELHQLPKQLNPLDMYNSSTLLTIMGPGGINDRHTITDDMRNVHPSHLGFVDPVHTPESDKVGIVYHLPVGVDSKDKTLLTRAINVRTGDLEKIDPAQFADSVVAFPGQYDARAKKWKDPKEIIALGKGNKTVTVKAKDVDYTLQSPKQVFSMATNLTPFIQNNNGGRTLIASKLAEQAVSLKHREKPLVQSRVGGNTTFEGLLGDAFAFRSPTKGVISKVTKNHIVVKDNMGTKHTINLYDNFPLNQKSFIDSIVKIKEGDIVKKGQVLADTNFTDDGVLALGKNLRTAYIPYKGYNFEDGIVITDEAAKKLTSEHMHIDSATESDRAVLNKKKFVAHYPNAYKKDQVSKLGEDGVVKKGTLLNPGDPVITKLRKDEIDPENIVFGKLARSLMRPWKDDSIKWEGDTKGRVVDVVRKGKHTKVYIRTEEPAKIGDKLVGRYGNKGIVTKIIPVDQAPHEKDGTPVDIMYNPHGIVTRMNIGQVLENAAGKVAKKTGSTYVVNNFSNENYTKTIKDLLKKNGMKGTEELLDPLSGKSLGQVAVGETYVLKLEKQAKSQFSARGAGAGWKYNQSTNEPVKGGEPGAKAVDLLMFYSMLAHGARHNLREMATHKATRNDDFWYALKTGDILPPPKPTFAYNKFISYMKAAGVDVKQSGSELTLAPMTDKEISKLSNGEIKNPQFVRAKDLAELRGGLMDKTITGGLRGTKWSHIELAEPIVNPVFEAPVRSLLGINKKTFDGITNGSMFVDEQGDINEEKGLTGGNAFLRLLTELDVEKSMRTFKTSARKSKSMTTVNNANKGIRYLEALKKLNLKPQNAYILNRVPVLPPAFRPIYALPDGNLHTSPVNFLYRDLGLVSDKLRSFNKLEYMPEDAKSDLRRDLYRGAAAVAGISSNPITYYPKKRRPRGIIEEIKGNAGAGSKTGFFQKHVLRREQDLVGRGTIIPEPKLGIDEAGIPEKMAWTIFQPFVMRELVGQGYKATDADKEIENQSFVARKALEAVMAKRPIFLNRAPSLHKFNVMAFNPKLIAGKAIKIPPLIVKGFNADFDGDTMHVHVPIMPKAVEEAKKMLPSRNLFNPGTGAIMMAPSQESSIGLYFLSKSGKRTKKSFKNAEALSTSLEKGDIDIQDMVRVAGKNTTAGRMLIDAVLPEKYRGRSGLLDKSGIKKLLTEIANDNPAEYANTVDKLTELGNEHAFARGFTVSIDDVQPVIKGRQKLLDDARRASKNMSDDKKVKLYREVDKKLKVMIAHDLGEQGNNLYKMVQSGARGDMNQLKQIVSAPLLVDDVNGNTLPIAIEGSFSTGMSLPDYWNSLYGARKGVVDKQLQTSKPGEFNKDLMATVVRSVVTQEKCNTDNGLDFDINDSNVNDRVLVQDVKSRGKVLARQGDIVTPNMVTTFRKHKVKKVKCSSPLTCGLSDGVCSSCYGLDSTGKFPELGTNIGAIAGQSMTEPLTQMTLNTMHSGGVSGSKNVTGFEKIDKLIKMPKIIAGKATLSLHDGKVTSIENAMTGGKNVFIGSTKHFVSPGNSLKVKIGSTIKKGDPISDGIIQPRELVDLKGMLPAQKYLVDEIVSAYKDTGFNILKKNVETVVQSVSNTTRVVDGGSSPYTLGDVIPYSLAESFNKKALGRVGLGEALGKTLHRSYGPVKKGTEITKRVADILKNLGHTEVHIGPEPIVHKPFMEGIKQVPLLSKDWMAQLGYGHIARAIQQGAGEGWTSDIHGYSPVPAFAYGAEFGTGEKGRY